jgi:periplasmic divalent cation tolerance protein
MDKTNYVQAFLTCGSWQEAQAIADTLLDKHLVACVEFIEIKSSYAWKGKKQSENEIKLIMQTIYSNLETINDAVTKLHSYEAFVLEAIPLSYINKEAKKWLESTITKSN